MHGRMTPGHTGAAIRQAIAGVTKVVVKIVNAYEDGHESEHEVEVSAPYERQGELSEWWEDVVYQHTGDGHGIDFDGGSCYTATIVAGPAILLGETYEWVN